MKHSDSHSDSKDTAAVPRLSGPRTALEPQRRARSEHLNAQKLVKHTPGEPGVWILILGDMIIFGLFFITFMVYRRAFSETFAESRLQMTQILGIMNTCLLLTSSFFVVRAVRNAELARSDLTRKYLLAASLCGILFLIIKTYEYKSKISSGISLTSNEFFMLYYVFTGIHAIHVMIGTVVLILLASGFKHNIAVTPKRFMMLEVGATFWHLVDMLWVVLFALFYVMR